MEYYIRGLLGLIVLIVIAFLLSSDKKNINWKLVLFGLLLQILFGVLITKIDIIAFSFSWVSNQFVRILDFSFEGTKFVFGKVATYPDFGFVFAFKVLPTVIFFATLSAGLYYFGILQYIIKSIAWTFSRFMKLSGAESLNAAGNIFLGQTEAPLLVKPFIKNMTKSELLCLMTAGMATISGGSLAGYVALLGGNDPVLQTKFATYLLSASFMNAPAAIIMAKILLPESEPEKIDERLTLSSEDFGVNFIDALAKGTGDGLKMALNIAAMLISFLALVATFNYLLSAIGSFTGLNKVIAESTQNQYTSFGLEYILGQIFRVLAYIIGISWNESLQIGSLLGQKMVLNEFIAYLGLLDFMKTGALSDRSILIVSYALCGFANFGSIAIQIGGIGGIVPSQQSNLSRLGIKALIAGSLATLLSATIAGALM